MAAVANIANLNTVKLGPRHLVFFDWERVYEEVVGNKAERGYDTLSLFCESLRALMKVTEWYELTVLEQEWEWSSFGQVREWENIAIALLRK